VTCLCACAEILNSSLALLATIPSGRELIQHAFFIPQYTAGLPILLLSTILLGMATITMATTREEEAEVVVAAAWAPTTRPHPPMVPRVGLMGIGQGGKATTLTASDNTGKRLG